MKYHMKEQNTGYFFFKFSHECANEQVVLYVSIRHDNEYCPVCVRLMFLIVGAILDFPIP